jgi:hypothetical protein
MDGRTLTLRQSRRKRKRPMPDSAPFRKPRILTDSEANTIRGKCLVGAASPQELMQLIGHFDLLTDKLATALETLAGCLPSKVYVYGAYGEVWSADEPTKAITDEYEVIDFKELLGENDAR